MKDVVTTVLLHVYASVNVLLGIEPMAVIVSLLEISITINSLL